MIGTLIGKESLLGPRTRTLTWLAREHETQKVKGEHKKLINSPLIIELVPPHVHVYPNVK